MNSPEIQLLSEAVTDLKLGRSFYDMQQLGVGDYFWDSLISDIESLSIYAGVHMKEFGYYRMLAKRFPYSVYYDYSKNVVSIIAVLPFCRNPPWLKQQMESR